MKIKKFNENINNGYKIFIIIGDGQITEFEVFENQNDMDNWILNMVNNELDADPDSIDQYNNVQGIYQNIEGEPIFINVVDAINWYQDYFDCDIYYNKTNNLTVKKDVKLKHGVEMLINAKKYNL